MEVSNLRSGRTEVRSERDTRGWSTFGEVENEIFVQNSRSRTRERRGRRPGPEDGYHSATSAHHQEFNQSVPENQELNGPFPPIIPSVPAAMVPPGAPCATEPLRPPMDCLHEMGCRPKAPHGSNTAC